MKEQTHISLEQYSGNGSQFMRVTPIADRFMNVADMRGDVVVEQKKSKTTYSYEQVGQVRIGKQHQFFGRNGERENPLEVFLENNTWIVRIDDQHLTRRANEKMQQTGEDKSHFNELFTADFEAQLRSGLSRALRKEKFLNNEDYSDVFRIGYMTVFVIQLYYGGLYNLKEAMMQPRTTTENLTVAVMTYLLSSGLYQMGMWGNGVLNKNATEKNQDFIKSNPFIRRHFWEIFHPIVPVDRYIRGRSYLWVHAGEFLES